MSLLKCNYHLCFTPVRKVFKPPSNLPYAGIYRNDGDIVRKNDFLVVQKRMNPIKNVDCKRPFGERSFDDHNCNEAVVAFANQRRNNSDEKQGYKDDKANFKFGAAAAPLLCLSWLVTLRDVLGIEKMTLDKDPIKDKIKQALLFRRHNRYSEAIEVLHEALKDAQKTKVEEYISRIYDEIANTYYEMDDFDKAFDLFREVIQRLIRLHGKNESSPEFIGISLKMANILARRGDLTNAEIGFKHCVSKQLKAMEDHQKEYLVEKGAHFQDKHPVETFGAKYSDPIVLFGMALEAYAYFLLEYFGSERLQEVEEFTDEVLKVSYHIYGSFAPHSVNLINNFGAKCIFKNQYKLARKYLELGLNRVLSVNDCEPIIVSYYCNYAEALFHTGDEAKAIEYARKAEVLSRSQETRIKKYAEKFLADMEKDARRRGIKLKSEENKGWRSWV